MGIEWLYWGNKRGRKSTSIPNEEAHPGCMCFQMFDIPHFQLALNQQSRSSKPSSSFLQQDPQEASFLKGVEAPRNSLDLDEVVVGSVTSSTMKIDQQNLNIPVGIKIRTSGDWRSRSRRRTDGDIITSSAGIKTPTLVARLMGLENDSPRISLSTPSSSKNTRYSNVENFITTATLSLPETPRISSGRRSDVDHQRLSLHINKENIYEGSNRSPRYYGRQIVKQVKQSVSRRVAHDITNTRKDDMLYDDEVVLLKPKQTSNPKLQGDDHDFNRGKPTTPRFRFSETKSTINTHHKPLNSHSTTLQFKNPKPPQQRIRKAIRSNVPKKPPQACDAIRTCKKEEPFLRATDPFPITILPSKKNPSPSPTKLLIKQESDSDPSKKSRELRSSWSESYKQMSSSVQEIRCKGAIISSEYLEYYLQSILEHTGIHKSTPLSLAKPKWGIFHHFELFNELSIFTVPPSSFLTLRCNRKLIFQLVNELLVKIYSTNYGRLIRMDGKELIHTLCMGIQSFPSANCQVLEDIDALIGKDLQETRNNDCRDDIVENIACDIMEELVHEVATC